MLTLDDLRELAVLTALGVVLGLFHLAVRPGLPLLSSPPATCELSPGSAPFEPEQTMSVLEDEP